MARTLKAPRYAEGVDPTLISFFTERLPYLDFIEASQWYMDWAPKLSRRAMALLGCNDRYFLLTVLCRRVDAIHPWIYDRAREVEERPDGYLDLWARFHYKSTLITFAGSIQEALIDPEIRICIFSNDDRIALPFLRQIQEELEGNEYLKDLYPDVLYRQPHKESQLWSLKDGLILKRKANPREATFEAHGVINALPVGKHFPLLVYDDIITEDNVTNPDMVKKATERTQLSFALGVGAGTRKRFAGTRYSYADSYESLLDKKIVIPRFHPATHDGRAEGAPVFMTPKAWEDLKLEMGPQLIASQMLQNPLAGLENTFKVAWLKSYTIRPRYMNVYIMVDPSAGKHKSSDRTAMAVVGVDSLLNRYLLDGYCHRMNLSERWEALQNLYRRWHPDRHRGVLSIRVGYEKYGQQADIEYFQEKMKEPASVTFAVDELNWVGGAGSESKMGKQAKKSRIGRLQPHFLKGKFPIPKKLWHPDIGDAVWRVTMDKLDNGEDNIESAKIVYAEYRKTKAEMEVEKNEPWRLTEVIKRLDEQRHIYDLVLHFFEEYRLDPFAPHDDFIDALSRLEDMQPARASLNDDIEVLDYPDA